MQGWMTMRALLVVAAIAVVASVPHRPKATDVHRLKHLEAQEGPTDISAGPPPGPIVNPCNVTTQGECDAVPCCTWCGSPWSAAGWCSAVAAWAKNCSKSVTTCDKVLNQTACCKTNMCLWTPVDTKQLPGCTAPPPPNPPQPPTPPTPPPAPGPPPKFSCDMATAEECDASPCCNWCSSTWNTSSSFCMPVLNEAVPMATCSKDEGPCDVKSASACR
jgi:hypothetical protein